MSGRSFLSIRKYEYDFITTVTIEFDDSFQSELSSSELLFLKIVVLFTDLDVRARLSISELRLLSDRRTILTGRGLHLVMISSPEEVSIPMNISQFLPP